MKVKAILILVSALIILTFSGCGEKIKYVYIKPQCPKLETFEVNTSKDKHFTIHYKVKEVNESSRNTSR